MLLLIARFLRRKIVLATIFSLSLTYCIVSFVREADQADNDILTPNIKNRPFLWRTLQEKNVSDDGQISCRNSVQGREIIVDDRGYVCPRVELQSSGCCNTVEDSIQYSCESCKPSSCCAIYEYCVSCCLHPEKKNVLENVLDSADAQRNLLFASVNDHFELCLAKCRTNSQSVQHENSYRNPEEKFCYGEMPKSTLPAVAVGNP